MGVKLVPPGLHYIYTSSSGDEVGLSRTGFFLHMKPQEVAVFRWDPSTEELVQPENQDEESRYADGARGFDFDANLGPYPLNLALQWVELTRHASAGLVRRIEPVGKAVRAKRSEYDAVSEAIMSKQPPDTAESENAGGDDACQDVTMESASEQQSQQQNESVKECTRRAGNQLESNSGTGTMFFTSIPRCRKTKGATPSDTTLLHMDRSEQLEQMLSKEYGDCEYGILGEVQVAYIAFLLGQNFDGFEQWRALLYLLCNSESSVSKRPELYMELCRTFFAQLNQAPGDLFNDDLTKENFMGSCVLSLLDICDSNGLPPKLRKRCGKLRELVQQKFGVSVEDLALLGEDAPQIVDMEGRDLVDLGGSDFAAMD